MAWNKWKASRPKASGWDKISARTPGETLTHREVHGDQQLDRGQRRTKHSNTPGMVVGVAVGVLAAVVAWLLYSFIAVAVHSAGTAMGDGPGGRSAVPGSYYIKDTTTGQGGVPVACFRPVNEKGHPDIRSRCHRTVEDVPVPGWWTAAQAGPGKSVRHDPQANDGPAPASLGGQLAAVSAFKLFLSLGSGALVAIVISSWTGRQVAKHNAHVDHTDINDHRSDQHIALPEEVQQNYGWFPDAGANSPVQVSSMISHMMLRKKGLGTV
jgi:hypothetical protein